MTKYIKKSDVKRLHRFVCGLIAAFIAIAFIASSAPAYPPRFQGLGQLPGRISSYATGVSADGMVVVGYCDIAPFVGREAFRWEKDIMTGLGFLPLGNSSAASGTNADGSVIIGAGWAGSTFPIGAQAVIWEKGVIHPLGKASAEVSSVANAVSGDGRIVVGTKYSGATSSYAAMAVRWTDSVELALGTPSATGDSRGEAVSSDGLVAVGFGFTQFVHEAFRWDADHGLTELGYLPGSTGYSAAFATNADGSVIVGGGEGAAFRWSETEGMVALGNQPGVLNGVTALAVSADGSRVVGQGVSLVSGLKEAFIWDEANSLRRLQDVLVDDYAMDLTGWHLSASTGISADGRVIVGTATNPAGLHEAWIAILDIAGDFNGDGVVNFDDLRLLIDNFGTCPDPPEPCPWDLNGDGVVDAQDLRILLDLITPGGPGGGGPPPGAGHPNN